MMLVKAGATDVTTYFHLRLSATGADATSLTITNIDLTYVRTLEEPSAKADATALADQDSAHSDNTAIEVDGTNMPGVYRVDWPDAAFAAGAREVILAVKESTIFTETLRVQLQQVPVDVTHWLGTAAATPTVAGVPEVDVTHWLGTAAATPTVAGVPEVDVTHFGGTAATSSGGRPEVNASHWAGAATATNDVALITAPSNFASLAIDASGNVAADVQEINGDSTAADNLAKTTRAIARGTVGSSSTTTSIVTSAFSPSGVATDQFKGRIVTFDADTSTPSLRGQATDITSSTDSAAPTLGVTALSTAPSSGDTFSVS